MEKAVTERVDYESPLEELFNRLTAFTGCLGAFAFALLMISLVFGVLGWIYGEDASGWTQPVPKVLAMMIIALLLTAFFGYIRSKVDVYYLLDHKRRQVRFHRKFFFLEGEWPVASYQELHCLAVGGKFVSESQGKHKPPKEYWLTALWLVTKSGRKIRVSDYKPLGSWIPEESKLPDALGVGLVTSSSANHALKVRRGPDGPEITFVGDSFTWVLGCLGGLALTLFLAVAFPALGEWLK